MSKDQKKWQPSVEYPLYNVCFMMKNGEQKVVCKEVGLRKGLEAMRKFDTQLTCNGDLIRDILYCFLFPLRDKKPTLDPETGLWSY